jgi:hypothetical protein
VSKNDLLNGHFVAWMDAEKGPESDIVISSRIRLARNLQDISLPYSIQFKRDRIDCGPWLALIISYALVMIICSSTASTSSLSPGTTVFFKISSEILSSTSFCRALFRGLAP